MIQTATVWFSCHSESVKTLHFRKLLLCQVYLTLTRVRLNPVTKAAHTVSHQEYEGKGHMSLVSRCDHHEGHYYIPRQYVIRSSSETKLRMVFNASTHDKAAIAMNNTLMVDPRMKPDLLDILVHIRQYLVAITADTEQMYKQVLVHPDDQP